MKAFIAALLLSIFLLPGAVSAEKPEEKKELYYVVFKEKTKKKFKTEKSDIDSVNQEGGKIKENFSALGISLVELNEKQVAKLKKKKNIQSVEKHVDTLAANTEYGDDPSYTWENYMSLQKTFVEDSYLFTKIASFETHSSYELSSRGVPNWALGEIGFKGRGVNIAVMDSGVGIGEEKPDEIPENRIKERVDCMRNNVAIEEAAADTGEILYPSDYLSPSLCRESTVQNDSHADLVTEIIVSKHNDKFFEGVAPLANIYSIKIKDSIIQRDRIQQIGGTDDWIRGWNWILEHNEHSPKSEKIELVNLSQTRPGYYLDEDTGEEMLAEIKAEKAAVNRLEEAGILLVTTAGNGGLKTKIGFPAKYDSAITVSAVDVYEKEYNKSEGEGNQHGPEVDISALGVDLMLNDGRKHSGTSFAAPMVTGILALLKEQYPDATNEELKWMLYAKAHRPENYYRFAYKDYPFGDYTKLKKDEKIGYGIAQADPWEGAKNSDQVQNQYGNDRHLVYKITKDQTVYNYPSIKSPHEEYGEDDIDQVVGYWGYKEGLKSATTTPMWAQLYAGKWVKKEDIEPGATFYLWNDTEILENDYPRDKVPQGKVKVVYETDTGKYDPKYTLDEEHDDKKIMIRQTAGTFDYDEIKKVDKTFETTSFSKPYAGPFKSEEYWDITDMDLPETVNVDLEWEDSRMKKWYRVKNEQGIAWLDSEDLIPVD